jgi:hypothetical protein
MPVRHGLDEVGRKAAHRIPPHVSGGRTGKSGVYWTKRPAGTRGRTRRSGSGRNRLGLPMSVLHLPGPVRRPCNGPCGV